MEFEASASTVSDSSATSFPGGEYEVFLSFCGDDTRYGFADHLYTYLDDVGVRTFRDKDGLRKGEEIGPELLNAIRESRISIPILSKKYASSKWCLMELAEMVKCNRSMGQMIVPIFYDVTPGEVKHQSGGGTYEKAFIDHKTKFDESKVKEWKEALGEVGAIKGWVFNKEADGYEGELIKTIVQKVLLDLKNYMFSTDNLIGMEHHENELMKYLHVGSDDVRIVGICGMGGIGKTTIAKSIYNKLFKKVKCRCFLENVRGSAQDNGLGLVSLQKQLLTETLRWCPEIANANNGINMIKGRFV